MAEENNSVIISIPKLRACAKTSEELVKMVALPTILKKTRKKFFRKPSEQTLKKYSLIKENLPSVDEIRREEILLPYRMFIKKQRRNKSKQRLGVHIYEKYKIRQTDLQRRLYVKGPPKDISTIIDVDKNFFNFVNGRPQRQSIPLFKSLKTALIEVFRLKVEIGYRNDDILNVDINHRNELETYELSVKRCMRQAKYFDAFISEDYKKSMNFLKNWDEVIVKLQLKVAELENLGSEQFTITSRLMGLDYKFHLQQKYGRFLYYLSPPSWRSKHRDFAHSVEIEAKGFDLGQSNEEETFLVIFDELLKQSQNPVHPALYFTEPGELIDIFNGIENHLYHHLDYVTHQIPQKKVRKDAITSFKKIIIHETALVYDTIKGFENILEFENEKCDLLKQKFFLILNGMFYDTVAATDVLKLFTHLEFCYERVYAERPMNIDIKSMAKSLECTFMDLCYKLENLQNEAVKVAIVKAIESEKSKFNNAKHASRELRLFNRLEKQLQRSHEPMTPKPKSFVRLTH